MKIIKRELVNEMLYNWVGSEYNIPVLSPLQYADALLMVGISNLYYKPNEKKLTAYYIL